MHILVLVLLGFGLVYAAWTWNNTLFVIQVSGGRVDVTRGQPPVRFVQTVREVVAFPPVDRATIKGVKTEGGVSIRTSGLDEGRTQRLRNAMRLSPQSQLRSGESPVNERNFWRALGLAWLIRMFFDR